MAHASFDEIARECIDSLSLLSRYGRVRCAYPVQPSSQVSLVPQKDICHSTKLSVLLRGPAYRTECIFLHPASQFATNEASFRTSIFNRRGGRHSKRHTGRLTQSCLVSVPKDLGVQVAAIIPARFDVGGSSQLYISRPAHHSSDADNYSEQARGKIVRWR